MEAFAIYLLKSACWLTGFTLVYFLFLRNERFFRLKRIYLIAGILISFIFPLISIHYSVELPAPVISTADLPQVNIPDVTGIQQNPDEPFNYRFILMILYSAGVLVLAVRAAWHVRMLYRTIRKAVINTAGPAKLVRASRFQASFSFFNYIFINPSVSESEVEEIMNHEIVHVRQKHWFDLLLVEMLRLVQWINPFAWIYTGFIRMNHEYLADETALQRTTNPANYRAALVNQLFNSPVISLSNSFNYSLNKKRFDMMKTIITSPYRKLKVFFILPVFAIVFYAFATPEYNYMTPPDNTITIYQAPAIVQKEVNGIILKEDGKPLQGVNITCTGTMGNAYFATSGADGRFTMLNVQSDATLMFSYAGYKGQKLKPFFTSEMKVIMVKDPEYKEPAGASQEFRPPRPEPLVIVDGVVVEKPLNVVRKELAYNFGTMKFLPSKEAVEKYGDKGKNGVVEIMTRKKAFEMGLKPPFPRLTPEDYPTFQEKPRSDFNDWILSQLKYPADAAAREIHGRVGITFSVELEGSLSNVKLVGSPDPVLAADVIKAIESSPKWDRPKNPDVDEAYQYNVTVQFDLPDKVSIYLPPFVVVEEMPQYPGGDVELLNFIMNNTKYPEQAKAEKIAGKVIVRFVVNPEGNVEDVVILKGVHPLLDAEAVRVVSSMKGFKPGMQGGRAVSVYYMVPVTFTLGQPALP